MKNFCIALATTLLATSAASQQIQIMGAGSVSCGGWAEARSSNSIATRRQYTEWLLGFMSGINWSSHKPQARPPDPPAVVAFIDNYCQNNPLDQLVWAGAVMVQESGGPKVVHDWNR